MAPTTRKASVPKRALPSHVGDGLRASKYAASKDVTQLTDNDADATATDDDNRRRPTHPRVRRDLPGGSVMTATDVAEFDAWIVAGLTAEPVAVAGAGAAKRVPDSDLRMFRERDLASRSPPSKRVRPSVMASGSTAAPGAQVRATHEATTRRLVDTLLHRVKPLDVDARCPLPELKVSVAAKDKATLQYLLAECKHPRKFPPSPICADSDAGGEKLPLNQQSCERLDHSTELPMPVPPDELFYRPNSSIGLDVVDLSDWAALCTEGSPILDHIARSLTSSCTELYLRGVTHPLTPTGFARLLMNCANVRRLDLTGIQHISKKSFAVIAQRCPRVVALTVADSKVLTDDLLVAAVTSFPALSRVDVSGCPRITDVAVAQASKRLHRVHELRLNKCRLVTDHGLGSLINTHGAELRVFSVNFVSKITNSTLQGLFVSQPKDLEELNVSDCSLVTDDGLEFLATVPSYYGDRVATAYHKLRIMDISGTKLTRVSCAYISASCPLLTSLRAARCSGICDQGLLALASLEHLTELDLTGCSQLSDSAMQRFLATDGGANSKPLPKSLVTLLLAQCHCMGTETIRTIATVCGSSLSSLDVSDVANGTVSVAAWISLVRSCPILTVWRCRGQAGINRAVIANLASINRVLRVIDLRRCTEIDDFAIYPLCVLQTLERVELSGGNERLTGKGLRQGLPPRLTELVLEGLSDIQFDDDMCHELCSSGRVSQLESLDITQCIGITKVAVATILRTCPNLYSLNTYQCPLFNANDIGRALYMEDMKLRRSKKCGRQERFEIDLIEDECSKFRGFSSTDPDIARAVRRREISVARSKQKHRAAVSIQVHFRSRARVIWRRHLNELESQRQKYAAINIQRITKGYFCRCWYVQLRRKLNRAAIYLQYVWRRRLQQRRVRKAIAFWTNRLAATCFACWKESTECAKVEQERRSTAEKASRALGFWGEKTVARIFHSWRTVVHSRTQKAKRALGFWKSQSLPRVLEAWAGWARGAAAHRQKLVCVFVNVVDLDTHNSTRQIQLTTVANRSAKKIALRRWRDFVLEQKRFLLSASISILSGNLMHWGFRQWKKAARNRRRLRDQHRKLLAKVLHRELYQSWVAWYKFILGQRAKRRALRWFTNSSLAKYWMAWKGVHEESLRIRQVSTRVAARLTQHQVARAIATWYEHTQEQKHSRQLQRKALAYFLNGSLIRTFTAWAEFAAHVRSIRVRWRARLEHANVHYAMAQWASFVRLRRELHEFATRIQAFWRGVLSRRATEDHLLLLLWATVTVQTAWRGRLARVILRIANRKAHLREYLRAEREREAMDWEDAAMQSYDRAITAIVMVQRRLRGVAARQFYYEVRRARYLQKKQREAELQDIVRAEAQRRQRERERQEKLRIVAAIEIQRHARGFLTRQWYAKQLDIRQQQRCAVRVQAVYRGRRSRRKTAAFRRSYLLRMEILSRRAVEGKLFRTMGAMTRSTQRPLRGFLSFLGLDPATFLLDIRAVLREVREDFQSLQKFFDVVKTRVRAASHDDLQPQGQPIAGSIIKRQSALWNRINSTMSSTSGILERSNNAKRFLKDLEQIVDTTATEQSAAEVAIRAGDAVRVVLRGHPRCGETAYVLGVHEDIAQVKLDVDGALEFLPLQLPATKVEPAKRVLYPVPTLSFEASSIGRGSETIHPQWRADLETYAKMLAADAKRNQAAKVIQCAIRVYLARLTIHQERELQGINAARRQQALLRVLQATGFANSRVVSILQRLHFVRPMDVPTQGLHDEPLVIARCVDRFQRALARRREIHEAYLRLLPVAYAGTNSLFEGLVLAVPPTRLLDRLVHYPLRWLQRVTRREMAARIEKKGQAEIASFVGGSSFVRTFSAGIHSQSSHDVDARSFCFEQLSACGDWCPGEGWALVHGVFASRSIQKDRTFAAENRLKLRGSKRQRVPHGWGVAHLLTGQVVIGGKTTAARVVSWRRRDAIEAQFRSLEIVKRMKHREKEERLSTQILARQGTWNTLRSKEGPRGYATRHAALSELEERSKVWYARFEEENALREREEELIAAEEYQFHLVLAKERTELDIRGQRLHELQQQVPETVTEVTLVPSTKTALEFLRVGSTIEVEYDDEEWYNCQIISLDIYEGMTAEILYTDDQRKETIKLIEDPTGGEVDGDGAGARWRREKDSLPSVSGKKKKKMSVESILAAAQAVAAANEVPFRKWRAGKAVEINWIPPQNNGAVITQYVVEWRDELDDGVTGQSIVPAVVQGIEQFGPMYNGDESLSAESTTLWPIAPDREATLRIRVLAENAKGRGLASTYMLLPRDLPEVSYRTAVPLTKPPPDTSEREQHERKSMGIEDTRSREAQQELTCTWCPGQVFGTRSEVDEHVAQTHAVPLVCPFRSCQQVCATQRALRYHMWRSSVSTPTAEERQSELFMEILDISRQYCMRKDRRHGLPGKKVVTAAMRAMQGTGKDDEDLEQKLEEEVYLEGKFQEALTAWVHSASELHTARLRKCARDRDRVRKNRYAPPRARFGVDFRDPEINVARREAILSTIGMLSADLEAYRLETNTRLDALRHEEKELQEYIALKNKRLKATDEEWQRQSLKRERKKAEKTLTGVQAKLHELIETSTKRIDEMMAEIARLTTLEQTFVPFIHHVIQLNRLETALMAMHAKGTSMLSLHELILNHYREDMRRLFVRADKEVAKHEEWDAMVAARRQQLERLREELRRLQMLHQAELEAFRTKRDEGDERFDLTKLRRQQNKVFARRERAIQELLALDKKRTRGEIARAVASETGGPGDDEIVTTRPTLFIANHDLALHERFLKGKSADAEYLRDEDLPTGTNSGSATAPVASGGVDGTLKGGSSAKSMHAAPSAADAGGRGASSTPLEVDDENDTQELGSRHQQGPPRRGRRRLDELPHRYVRLEGEFVDGRIDGPVRIEYNDGSIYEGPWVNPPAYDPPPGESGTPTKTRYAPMHWGKFTFHDGTVWEGEAVDNFFSPLAATGSDFHVTTPLTAAGGGDGASYYVGDVRQGRFHGFGTLTMHRTVATGEYVGEWCEGQREGYGIERWDHGELYEGYWSHDRYHGHGDLVYDDGSKYEGEFRYGLWHGDGIRTTATGDRLRGRFTDGYLDGPGVLEYADKRHYVGEFRRTRRHGSGALTFPNGDRYEGPFEDDEMHGDGRYTTKTAATLGGGDGEPLVRLGRWVRGERVAWLSQPSSQLATATFIRAFATVENVAGELEMDLVPGRFRSPYAVLVAQQLPRLPEGVDGDDPFVQSIVRMLAKTQNVVLGAGLLDDTTTKLETAAAELTEIRGEHERVRNDVDAAERSWRLQRRTVQDVEDDLAEKTAREEEMQVLVETFWKQPDARELERQYQRAVEGLRSCEVMDWYRLRTAPLDNVHLSLLSALATLLNFTTNYYLQGRVHEPTRDEIMMLLSSNEENVHLGDREGLIHRYDVKALYLLPLFDVYSFSEGTRQAMLHGLTPVIHHPRLRPNNVRLHQVSPALAAVCAWVRAAYMYAKRAMEIAPVARRVLDQLVILQHLRETVARERLLLEELETRVASERRRLATSQQRVEAAETKERGLRKILEDIAALDAAEHVPLTKSRIKKPQSYRPPSASIPAKAEAGDQDENEDGDDHLAKPDGTTGGDGGDNLATQSAESRPPEDPAAAPQPPVLPPPVVNHRQVFEEDHGSNGVPREHKEDVLVRIVSDPELGAEFALLKKEVRKVLDRHGGKVPVDEFPGRFEETMLKPLAPQRFGLKKMRNLLLLMPDTCVLADPLTEEDVESVQLPPEPEEPEDLAPEEEAEAGDGGNGVRASRGPPMPRERYFCRVCPGISYKTPGELQYHDKTKWHGWNLEARRQGRRAARFTLASACWSEAYDSTDNAICYYNRMTGEVHKGPRPPREVEGQELLLELLADGPSAPEDPEEPPPLLSIPRGGDASEMDDPGPVVDSWEEVADEAGNVYFYNRETGASSWTRPEVAPAPEPLPIDGGGGDDGIGNES